MRSPNSLESVVPPIPQKVFKRDVPELGNGAATPNGTPVQVQILGGNPALMAQSAFNAYRAGATAIDINFGCPAPTVNRHDGGASLLQHPVRIREIVAEVRSAVPAEIPVSAKLRLGWDCIEAIEENAAMAAEGGASWLTIHARTRVQGYSPPVYWKPIGKVRASLNVPVIANGDIWTLNDFHRCQDETQCCHFMIGRGALADPLLSYQIAHELGIGNSVSPLEPNWPSLFELLIQFTHYYSDTVTARPLMRFKQWLNLAAKFGRFAHFDQLKHTRTVEEFFACLAGLCPN